MNSKNTSTEKTILDIGYKFDQRSGIALVCAYENQNLLARVRMSGKRVLELGCGTLPACFGISNDQMPSKYLATDLSDNILTIARNIDKRPQYKVVYAENIFHPNQSFDIIILRGVLHHLQNPTLVLRNLKRKLKPNGEILLYEPNLSCIPANLLKWFLRIFLKLNMEKSPYGQLSQKSIRMAIKDAKLTLDDVWYSSLLAFPLTGDYGRLTILPNNLRLYKNLISFDKFLSHWIHKIPMLAKWSHFRVIFLLR